MGERVRLDADTVMSDGTWPAVCRAAGGAVMAVDHVVGRRFENAFVATRPPGHHAEKSRPMGFCFLNNAAIAARHAQAVHGMERVAIVDFDVHHGNGTQEAFYDNSRVGFLSIHRYPFYPGTGAADETGTGDGLGATINVPVAYGTPRSQYHDAFRKGLETLADRIRPELVLISAGFDAHAEDPVGDLGLDVDDFEILTKEIVSVADTYAKGRIVSVLEGGYNVSILAGCVEVHLHALGAERGRI